MASDVHIKLLEYALTFIQSKVQSPPTQNRIQLCDGRLQGCPSAAMEDVLQLVAESCEALGVRSGRARRADEGVTEKFRSVRVKHAALVTVYPQPERPLYESNQVLEHTLSRSFASDVDVVVVCVAREFQAALFQILVELVQDDQRQDRAQRRALWGSSLVCTTPSDMMPVRRYRRMSLRSILSSMCFSSFVIRRSWLTVSKNFARSISTTNLQPSAMYRWACATA